MINDEINHNHLQRDINDFYKKTLLEIIVICPPHITEKEKVTRPVKGMLYYPVI